MKIKIFTDPNKLKRLEKTLIALAHGLSEKPLHSLLSMAIVQCIRQGDWVAGDRIPTESELIELSGFSLGTVQRALRSLTNDGTLVRKQGSGSFVNDQPQPIIDVAHARFLDSDGKQVLSLYSHVLRRSIVNSRGPWSVHFPNPQAQIIRIERLMKVNNEFCVFNRFYFDGCRFKQMAMINLKELDGMNFKTLLEREFNISWGAEFETLRIIQAPASACRAMKLPEGQTVGLLEISRQDREQGHTLYFQEFFIPPSHRKLLLLPR